MSTRWEFEAIGTHWVIDYENPPPGMEGLGEAAAKLKCAIEKLIEEFDKNYSRFRQDGLIARIAEQAGSFELPVDARRMLELYERVYRITGGVVTPLIGQVLVDAGYDAEYSLKSKLELVVPPTWGEVFGEIDYENGQLTTKQPAVLDFGAAGKGYLVDLVAELMASFGLTDFTVDAGGDMCQRSSNASKLRVGLEDPRDTSLAIGVVEIGNQSLCGSAGNRRKWGKYHHIIDSRTLESPQDILAVWVMAETTMLADMLTTCLFFMEPKIMLDEFEFDYLIMYADGSVVQSTNFGAELFY